MRRTPRYAMLAQPDGQLKASLSTSGLDAKVAHLVCHIARAQPEAGVVALLELEDVLEAVSQVL
jgi:hypothetical protein